MMEGRRTRSCSLLTSIENVDFKSMNTKSDKGRGVMKIKQLVFLEGYSLDLAAQLAKVGGDCTCTF